MRLEVLRVLAEFELQWGRVWEDAEMYFGLSSRMVGDPLQWGRVWEDAEIIR